ncbi:MAG: 1,4-dihydroxy-2-naphthoate polyprenyltransferase [Anaerolineae bacterium]|nr:1,4-dihydroxy-2-naphthoate polyprenyltransferase [Anaerolineae bacterium]
MTTTNSSPSQLQIWLLASRPKTLPAAAAPVLVGTAVAISEHAFRLGPALAALLGALLIQIGTNFANDVFDFKKGADTTQRLGPMRVTQAGLLSPEQVMLGMWLTFGLATLIGLYLVFVGGWPIVVIGLLSIMSGIAYTGGPFPLGYNGLGDLFVFIFFGLVAVCGTYYVQAGTVSPASVWAAVPVGLLATAILVVNNLRDIDTDRVAGKKTLAVRFGEQATQIEYFLLLGLSYIIPPLMWLLGLAPIWVLLTWLSIPMIKPLHHLIMHEKGRPLNMALAGTARLELVYSVLLSLGFVLGRIF